MHTGLILSDVLIPFFLECFVRLTNVFYWFALQGFQSKLRRCLLYLTFALTVQGNAELYKSSQKATGTIAPIVTFMAPIVFSYFGLQRKDDADMVSTIATMSGSAMAVTLVTIHYVLARLDMA